ncbi:hypothetical protein MMC14_003017 [Varicellaria rhodocarpa]|nr:hypothetical protein [Varicellaria rhodocarpa]
MRFAIASLISAAFTGLTAAYTTPVGANPSGNAIYKPALNEVVPVNQAYTITWNPTIQGTVTLVLLRGPSTNILPLYPIVEKIPNTGSYIWTPSSSLQPDTTHYGIQLIDDQTGAYQYTSQFGISNPSYTSAVATTGSVTSATAAVSEYSDGQPQAPTTATAAAGATSSAVAPVSIITLSTGVASTFSPNATYTTPVSTAPLSTFVASTGGAIPASNSSFVRPTVSLSVPASLLTSTTAVGGSSSAATAATSPISTGAAGKIAQNAGGALVGLAAVLVFLQ